MRKRPDICGLVFVCAFKDWQVQVSPAVRSDLGGHDETFRAITDAHHAHVWEEHTEAQREAMREELEAMGAPGEISRPAAGNAAAFMTGVELPRWWVNR